MATSMQVLPCQPADMPRACAINFDAMGRGHVLMDEFFPLHWTSRGRKAALERYTRSDWLYGDANMFHFKVLDQSLEGRRPQDTGTLTCDPYVAYGRWHVKPKGVRLPFETQRHQDLGDWWATRRDKRFVEWLLAEFVERRRAAMRDTATEQSLYCLDALCILPGFQGSGAGSALLRWGTDRADRDGALCVLESAVTAESFYAKHGFEAVEHVRFGPPAEFADKGTQEMVWMVRQPRRGSTTSTPR